MLAAGAAAAGLALGGIDSTTILTGNCMVESVCRPRNCTCVLAGLATLRLPGLLYRTGLVATYRCGRVPDARFPGDVSLCTCASGCVERVGLTLWRGRNAVYCEIVRSERRYGRRVAAITQPTSRLLADDGGIDGVVNSQRARNCLHRAGAPASYTCRRLPTAFCEFCVPTDRNLVKHGARFNFVMPAVPRHSPARRARRRGAAPARVAARGSPSAPHSRPLVGLKSAPSSLPSCCHNSA